MFKIIIIKNRISKFLRRFVNGPKGAVTILLALVMSPLLSISVVLIEWARYQNAQELMQELVDSADFSTLADYDSYIDQRFGLMATSQSSDVKTSVSKYLRKNTSSLGQSITVNDGDIKSSGKFALSNANILKQQILENCEISAPAEILARGINLKEMIEKLEKSFDLDNIRKQIDATKAGIEVAEEVEKIVKAVTELNKETDKYNKALEEYNTAYNDFSKESKNYIKKLKDANDNLEEGADHENIYTGDSYTQYIKHMKKAKDNYLDKTKSLKTEVDAFAKNVDTFFNSTDALPGKIETLQSKVENNSKVDNATTTTFEWIITVSEIITHTLKTELQGKEGFDNAVIKDDENLNTLIGRLNKFNKKTYDETWVVEYKKNSKSVSYVFGKVRVSSIPNNIKDIVSNLVDAINKKAKDGSDSSISLQDLGDIASEMLNVGGLYNSSLDAEVKRTSFYSYGSPSFADNCIVKSVQSFTEAITAYKDGIKKRKILKILEAQIKIFKSVVEFLNAIVGWATKVASSILGLVKNGIKELYNSAILFGYGAYNLPNRTNFYSGKTLSGYDYKQIFKLSGGAYKPNEFGGCFKNLDTFNSANGKDAMFKGAEAEYILSGTSSERGNQCAVFFNLYMIRLILDFIPALVENNEVSAMAATLGPAGIILKIVVVIVEPLLDTLILVGNESASEYLFKKQLYLTPSGISELAKDLAGNASQTFKDRLSEVFTKGKKQKGSEGGKNNDSVTKGYISAKYTDHILIMMMLTVSQSDFMSRMQNLIQLESKKNSVKSGTSFSLDKTYTYIRTKVNYTLNPMFKLDVFSNDGKLKATCTKNVGY